MLFCTLLLALPSRPPALELPPSFLPLPLTKQKFHLMDGHCQGSYTNQLQLRGRYHVCAAIVNKHYTMRILGLTHSSCEIPLGNSQTIGNVDRRHHYLGYGQHRALSVSVSPVQRLLLLKAPIRGR